MKHNLNLIKLDLLRQIIKSNIDRINLGYSSGDLYVELSIENYDDNKCIRIYVQLDVDGIFSVKLPLSAKTLNKIKTLVTDIDALEDREKKEIVVYMQKNFQSEEKNGK